jgi:hypothetical protein
MNIWSCGFVADSCPNHHVLAAKKTRTKKKKTSSEQYEQTKDV